MRRALQHAVSTPGTNSKGSQAVRHAAANITSYVGAVAILICAIDGEEVAPQLKGSPPPVIVTPLIRWRGPCSRCCSACACDKPMAEAGANHSSQRNHSALRPVRYYIAHVCPISYYCWAVHSLCFWGISFRVFTLRLSLLPITYYNNCHC
jgi:hypothetical protein